MCLYCRFLQPGLRRAQTIRVAGSRGSTARNVTSPRTTPREGLGPLLRESLLAIASPFELRCLANEPSRATQRDANQDANHE